MAEDNSLLAYYQRELAYIRRTGAEFAKANPKVASRLRMSAEKIEDPHVSRLIESFAFLNARVRSKLDDDFPELTNALLDALYPHYLAPVPSMAMVQLQPSSNLAKHSTVKKGTLIETLPVEGEPVRFQTCYETVLHPIKVSQAFLYNHRRIAPQVPNNLGTQSVLRLTLNTLDNSKTFKDLAPGSIRVFLNGQNQQMYALYELLFSGVLKIALAKSPEDKNAVFLSPDNLKPVGFDADQGMLPYSGRSFLGYRLLTEFFTFPEKFLFFDIAGLTAENLKQIGNALEIFFYLKTTNRDLENHINAANFALHCTPVVNLFKHRAEPISLKHTEPEYRVIPDVRRQKNFEVYRVENITAVNTNGEEVSYLPFYGVQHGIDSNSQRCYWYASRRAAETYDGTPDNGTELFISLVDLDFKPSAAAGWALDIETLCSNRDLPQGLPFGGDQPYLQFTDLSAPVEKIKCLTPPTATRRVSGTEQGHWRLISHLTLNHLSLTDSKEGVEALREMLRLYDFEDNDETRAMIEAVRSIKTDKVVARDPSGGLNGFCQGQEITVEFDQTRFAGSSVFLFASILERFFSLYVSINAFTKLTAVTKDKRKVIYQWPARIGDKTLL